MSQVLKKGTDFSVPPRESLDAGHGEVWTERSVPLFQRAASAHRTSEYMHWAKTQQRAEFTLATSGVAPCPIEELDFDWTRMVIQGDNNYGYAPLLDAIAARSGVSRDWVVTAQGTSFANYLAMAALLDPGDEVLIERPAYALLVDAALQIGAVVRHFDRDPERDFALDAAAVRRAVTPRTRLIVVTNPHNPTSDLASVDTMRELAELARESGAKLLVDEVYLDAVWENAPPSSIHLGPSVVVTSGLTKVYGFNGLRCGWILAEPDLARAMWRMHDLFGLTSPHPAELLSLAAFERLPLLRERARGLVEADRAELHRFLDAHPQVAAPRLKHGTTSFIKLLDGGTDAFLDRLRSEHGVSAVPGRFFDAPDYFRVGMGVDPAKFAEGLRRMGIALQALRR